MDLTQTSKCDAELWGHSKVVMAQPLDITDLHLSPFWNLLPLPLRAARLHTPWTQDRTFVPPTALWFTALGWFLVCLPPPLPSRPKFWALDTFINVITSDFWSLITFEQAAFSGLSTGDAGVWWKLTHPHLHFHIFIARWENYGIA